MRRALLIFTALLTGLALTGSVAALTTASVANLSLTATPYAHNDRASDGSLLLSVSSDETAGWNVSLSVSAFAYSGTFAGSSIPAANFSIIAANTPTLASGQAINATGGPKVPDTGATGSLDVPRKVLQAEAGFGQGSYAQAIDVRLLIPGLARAGTYTADLTVTTATGP